MQKIKPDVPQTLKVYSDFLINVLNDKETAISYLEKLS